MAGLKATSLFVLGTLAGLGAACVVVGALWPDCVVQFRRIGSVAAVLAGIWLVAIGLLGGIGVTRGPRMWRLRSAMATIAILAVLLGTTVGIRRRAERFAGMASYHLEQGQRIADQAGDLSGRGPDSERAMALLRQIHWHQQMWMGFNRAAARPWLPVPHFAPCTCNACATPKSSP